MHDGLSDNEARNIGSPDILQPDGAWDPQHWLDTHNVLTNLLTSPAQYIYRRGCKCKVHCPLFFRPPNLACHSFQATSHFGVHTTVATKRVFFSVPSENGETKSKRLAFVSIDALSRAKKSKRNLTPNLISWGKKKPIVMKRFFTPCWEMRAV